MLNQVARRRGGLPGASIPPCSTRATRQRLARLEQRRFLTLGQLDEDKRGRERVVILGSGWAGYPLAMSLDKTNYQAIIVSPRSYFAFTPLLASTSVGTLEFRNAVEPIRRRHGNVHFLQGWADNLSFDQKVVTVEEAVVDPKQGLALTGRASDETTQDSVQMKKKRGQMLDLSYDKLVIGVGSYAQTFNTPGIKEHANFLKDVGDARKIRKKILECFETAALPTSSDQLKSQLLHFCIVGGGPTGIEFSAELHDVITEDLNRIYPELAKFVKITVYDVASKVLGAFDDKLASYATETFRREGIEIKTSHHVENLERGLPGISRDALGTRPGLTLTIKEQGNMGVGMVVWSTGLMANPLIAKQLAQKIKFPKDKAIFKWREEDAHEVDWTISRDVKSGSILTNDRLRVILEAKAPDGQLMRAFMKDVWAIGDCAIVENTSYPATAQVANQKASWLAKRLNKNDLHQNRFTWKNLGTMAYLGNWKAILQGGSGGFDVSGRTAWIIWRSAYLVKSVSWRNRILIPIYWFVNWAFGRDISRF